MTLKYTLDQVRSREVALIGTKGPTVKAGTPWWGLNDPDTNDCLGFQLYCLGVRSRTDYAPHFVSISAFRSWAGWDEVAIGDVQAGDLICEEWPNRDKDGREKPITGTPGHIEYAYSPAHDEITIISANTGPTPGTPLPRGAWKKIRPRDHHLLFGIRPPYKEAAPSSSRKAEVRAVATYVNRDNVLPDDKLPHGYPKTASASDGIEGPIYWTRVQTWGRLHGLYGPTYKIDGIPGPRTRTVEAAAFKAAKKG